LIKPDPFDSTGQADNHLSEYSVYWVSAVNMEAFERSVKDIAEELKLPCMNDRSNDDPKEAVRRYLSRDPGKWLLIVDNADNKEVVFGSAEIPDDRTDHRGIIQYLPRSNLGFILFTTRFRDIAQAVAGKHFIELGAMDKEEAVELLKSSIRKLRDDDIQDHGEELLEELEYLPLAIRHAAAYIDVNDITLATYLKHFRQQVDKDWIPDEKVRKSVAKTWIITFDRLRESSEESERSAAELLAFLSFIEPKSIPQFLLPPLGGNQQLAVQTLCRYCFLTERGKRIFDMHRLVQLATRVWLEQNNQISSQKMVVLKHVSEVFWKFKPVWENRHAWRACLPHALRVIKETKTEICMEREDLLGLVGAALLHDGRFRESVRCHEELQKLAKCRGDRYRTLTFSNNLAMAYRNSGQIKEAIDLLTQIVEVEKSTHKEEHPMLFRVQANLAGAYLDNGQVREAIEVLTHILNTRKNIFEDDPDILQAQGNLAMAYLDINHTKEAVQLLTHIVDVKKGIYGEGHPALLLSQHNLAAAYREDGRIQDAIELFQHVIDAQQKVFPEDHPSLLTSRQNLAVTYQACGRLQEAMELLTRITEIRKKTHQPDHPDLLMCQKQLAETMLGAGQLQKAIDLLSEVVVVEQTKYAENHPVLLLTKSSLATAYLENGQLKQAIDLFTHVISVLKCGQPDYSMLLRVQHNLAMAYQRNGQAKEAVGIFKEIIAVKEEIFGKNHPSLLSSQHGLGVALRDDGQVKEAIQLLEYVCDARKKLVPQDQTGYIRSQHFLALAYYDDGRVTEAIELLERVVDLWSRAQVHKDHPKRIESEQALARLRAEQNAVLEETASDTKEKAVLEVIRPEVSEETDICSASTHPQSIASQQTLVVGDVKREKEGLVAKSTTSAISVEASCLSPSVPSRGQYPSSKGLRFFRNMWKVKLRKKPGNGSRFEGA